MSTLTDSSKNADDDCTICLNSLGLGSALLTLSCGHKFHLQCLVTNVKAQNKECPLCRATIEDSILNLLSGHNQAASSSSSPQQSAQSIPSVEDLVDETAVRQLSDQLTVARQTAVSSYSANNTPLITVTTTLEYGGQPLNKESNIYGFITVKAPPVESSDGDALTTSHLPIDLVCVVDQSGSMGGEKIHLLRKTLIYITEQLNQYDRLAIISFDTTAVDRSHGLKRVNQQNQMTLKRKIEHIRSGGGTYIGSGLEMGIQLLNNRQTKNTLGALLLLTDGQDNEQHDYTQLMQTLPQDIQCHTFGYGADHTPSLLVKIAELGHEGTFTYIDEQQAVGPAFAMALAGLFTCIAQQIRVNIQFNGDYKITNVHSTYPYEPQQLPSSQIIFKLNNLNADENRNLVFQLHVPKIQDQQSIEMNTLEATSQSQTEQQQQQTNQNIIGNVSVTYVEPNSNQTYNTESVPFHLIRVENPSDEDLKANYQVDLQRNRIETANVIKLAMEEYDYQRSLNILKAQVEKIQLSISAQDPFCRNLIRDLEHRYPTEQEYRSSQYNSYRVYHTERGTYIPSSTTNTRQYVSRRQQLQAADYTSKNS